MGKKCRRLGGVYSHPVIFPVVPLGIPQGVFVFDIHGYVAFVLKCGLNYPPCPPGTDAALRRSEGLVTRMEHMCAVYGTDRRVKPHGLINPTNHVIMPCRGNNRDVPARAPRGRLHRPLVDFVNLRQHCGVKVKAIRYLGRAVAASLSGVFFCFFLSLCQFSLQSIVIILLHPETQGNPGRRSLFLPEVFSAAYGRRRTRGLPERHAGGLNPDGACRLLWPDRPARDQRFQSPSARASCRILQPSPTASGPARGCRAYVYR